MRSLGAKKLTKEEIEQIVQIKLNWILSFDLPEIIYLFGSAITGEMTNASDLDLIVVYDSEHKKKLIKKQLFKSRPLDDWPHDLLFYTLSEFNLSCKKGGGVCWSALQNARVIFRKNKGDKNDSI